jgi:hypothetical protein
MDCLIAWPPFSGSFSLNFPLFHRVFIRSVAADVLLLLLLDFASTAFCVVCMVPDLSRTVGYVKDSNSIHLPSETGKESMATNKSHSLIILCHA